MKEGEMQFSGLAMQHIIYHMLVCVVETNKKLLFHSVYKIMISLQHDHFHTTLEYMCIFIITFTHVIDLLIGRTVP